MIRDACAKKTKQLSVISGRQILRIQTFDLQGYLKQI